MFEHRTEPLLPRVAFAMRFLRHAAAAVSIVLGGLAIGILGYRGFEGLPWIDATVNAAMILGGMGPVNQLHQVAGKLFATFYALFSGLVFLVTVAVLFAPLAHRLLHHFHLDLNSKNSPAELP